MITFDYLQRVVVDGQLSIEDIGNTVILGRNDVGEEFYLLIGTYMGWTTTIEYGPAIPDLALLPQAINLKYNRFEFNQGKIERAIDKFLNDPKRLISQAEEVCMDAVKPIIDKAVQQMFIFDDSWMNADE